MFGQRSPVLFFICSKFPFLINLITRNYFDETLSNFSCCPFKNCQVCYLHSWYLFNFSEHSFEHLEIFYYGCMFWWTLPKFAHLVDFFFLIFLCLDMLGHHMLKVYLSSSIMLLWVITSFLLSETLINQVCKLSVKFWSVFSVVCRFFMTPLLYDFFRSDCSPSGILVPMNFWVCRKMNLHVYSSLFYSHLSNYCATASDLFKKKKGRRRRKTTKFYLEDIAPSGKHAYWKYSMWHKMLVVVVIRLIHW